jgi:hypothetical protein
LYVSNELMQKRWFEFEDTCTDAHTPTQFTHYS